MTAASSKPSFEQSSADRLVLMLFIAVAIHALIILGISFQPFSPEPPDRASETLDITIVNKKKTPPPEEADYLAESSQEGGGNTQEKVQPTEQMIEQAPPMPIAESKPEPTPVLTRDNSVEKTRQADVSTTRKEREKLDAGELINQSMEMLTLNQQINQSLKAYSREPRSKYISARTREFKYANYMRDWVAKVERVGDLNYPDAARRKKLSGSLIVEVVVYADGTVREITILKPSGHKVLDDAAVRIVRLAAPFPPFPESIRKETDVLHITRTWVFQSNRLQGH